MTGITTRMMKAAPKGAVYIWTDSKVRYPRKLAENIGRPDLAITHPMDVVASWVVNVQGGRTVHLLNVSAVVIDHALSGETLIASGLANRLEIIQSEGIPVLFEP